MIKMTDIHRENEMIVCCAIVEDSKESIVIRLKATPHKARLTAWRHICLHLFRHLARKFLAGRQPSGVIFIQSDEKSDCASAPPALCGVA